jgi:superoxide dismutase, Fe-Mn family
MKSRRKFIFQSIAGVTGLMFAGSLRSSARMSEKVLLLSEGHTLPSLPYEYDALEPFIDAETMRIHHGKHHKGYVDKLNQALKENKSEGLTLEEIFAQINKFPSAIRNNAGGHYNHTLFWESMQGVPQTRSPYAGIQKCS